MFEGSKKLPFNCIATTCKNQAQEISFNSKPDQENEYQARIFIQEGSKANEIPHIRLDKVKGHKSKYKYPNNQSYGFVDLPLFQFVYEL